MSTLDNKQTQSEFDTANQDETPSPSLKNSTYERALSAFFEGAEPTKEQRELLPSDVDGLSVKRQALVDKILQEESSREQLSLLKQLRLRFGLSSDIRILYLSLTTEDELLAQDALQLLVPWLEARSGDVTEQMKENLKSWRPALNRKVDTLLLRSFNPKIQKLAQQCSSLLF